MSGRKRKEFWLSNQANDQGSRPNSAHGSGRSTLDPYSSSHPTVDPRFSDRSITDTRFSGRATPDQQRTTGPHRSQRSHVPPPIPYPSFSGQATPNQQPITHPYAGQPIPQATSGGQPGPYSDPRFVITDPRFSDQPAPNQQRINDPYGGQRFHVPQPAAYPSFSGRPAPDQQRITDSYGGQPILEAASSGHPGLYSSIQPTPEPRSGQHTLGPRSSDQGGQRTPDPISSGQSTSAPRSNTPVSSSSISRPINPHFGDQLLDPWSSGRHAPYQQRTTDPYPGVQRILQPNSSGQSISDGIYTITNVYQKRFIYLEDANDKTPLRGHYNPENRSARWQLKRWVDGEYSIKNVDNGRYANCESRARLDAFVEGDSEEQVWRIQERRGGQYTIAAIDNGNLWMLPDKVKDTPVTFSKVPSDPMCLWSFESAEIVAPVNENPVTGPVMSDTGLLPVPPGGQPMPEAAITELTSAIAGAPDLLHPLRAACKALRVVLQRAENIGHVNEDREVLIKRLKFHLATVENDIAKLEEDQEIDGTIPALNQEVKESLETYARELEEIDGLLSVNRPEGSSLMDEVTSKTRKIDEIFQIYTTALHRFAASTVDQMRQQLARFQQESEKAHTIAEKARPIRPNAYGIQHRKCLQGTREKTLRAISNWADNENAENWILFFLDVAGSGKSTVAKHMAEKWKREKRLLARFFFSRDTTTTMSTDSFCSTVANAFAVLDPEFKKHMDKVTKRPDLGLLSFEELFEALVVGPLSAIGRRAILIIDALDECHPEQRDQLLQTLRDQHGSMPLLRILATGRPERDIKHWAEDKFGFGYANFVRLEESEKDVELYIKHRLQDLVVAQDRLYPVIRHAEGLFIWARIACDLLLDSDDIDDLLEELGKEVSLDYLYKVALEQSMPKERPSRRAMIMVLQMILAAKEPLSIAELEILSPKRDVVEKVVTRLSSVLLYQGREGPIRLLHATFREFLTAQSKADIFFIQLELGHHTLASGCLNTINDLSKQKQGYTTIQELDAISQRRVISFE